MDYIEGASLHEMLRRFGKFPPELALDLGMQIARAIEAAHKTGIIHRDLKPSNVMVADKEGNLFYAIVLDFGLAKSLTGDETVLTANRPRHRAPPTPWPPNKLKRATSSIIAATSTARA